jgi:hypothetical protein
VIVESYGPTRVYIVSFGITLFASLLLLADLLGSFADSTATFTGRLASDAERTRDIAGGALLLVAALLVVCSGQTLRHDLSRSESRLGVDLISALSMVAASGLLASSGLLLAPPVSNSFGAVFSDPGIEGVAAAGIAQTGTVLLYCTLLFVGIWTILVARVARTIGVVGPVSWTTALMVGALTLFSISVVATLPVALWWVAFGLTCRLPATKGSSRAATLPRES